MAAPSRLSRLAVPLLLSLAAALRLLYLRAFLASPEFPAITLDETNYQTWAHKIAAGDVLGTGAFVSNPLEPYALAVLYRIVGDDPWSPRLAQVAASVATCGLIYVLTRNLAGRRAGLVALFLAAIYGPMIFLPVHLVAESWVLLCVGGALALLTRPAAPPWTRGIAGLAFAVGILGRPNLLLLAPVLPLAAELAESGIPREVRAGRVGIWFLGLALGIAPVAVRNRVAGGEWVLVTAHSGVNLWIGNNPDADGYFKTPMGSGLAGTQEGLVSSSIQVAQTAVGHPLSPVASSGWWTDRALGFARDQPSAFAALTLRKVGLVLNWYEKPLESHYEAARARSLLLQGCVGFGVLAPLALAGLVWTRRRWRALAVVVGFVVLYTVSVVVAFVAMRYRVPVVLGAIPLAAIFLAEMSDALRRRAWRPVGGGALALIGGYALVHLPLADAYVDQDQAFFAYTLGSAAQQAKQYPDALVNYQEAVRLFPEHAGFYNNLGITLIDLGRPLEATTALQTGISLGDPDPKLERNLGKAWTALGEYDKAVDAYRAALQRDPHSQRTQLLYQQAEARLQGQGSAAPPPAGGEE